MTKQNYKDMRVLFKTLSEMFMTVIGLWALIFGSVLTFGDNHLHGWELVVLGLILLKQVEEA